MSQLEKAISLREAGDSAGASTVLQEFLASSPKHALAHYTLACTYDSQRKESLAIPHYEAGLAGDLEPSQRRSAYLGLGSSYRALGRYQMAHDVLRSALIEFPGAAEIEVFLAMAEHNLGRSQDAVRRLLKLLLQSTSNDDALRYKNAIDFYTNDLSAVWADD